MTPGDATWEDTVRHFQALGGIALNVSAGPGVRGLSASDPEQPYVLRIPESLLVATKDVDIVEGRVRIQPAAAMGTAERAFFEHYANAFSWPAERLEIEEFLLALERLPADVRGILDKDFGILGLLIGERSTRVKRMFLDRCTISSAGRNVVAPFLDLARHAPDGVVPAREDNGAIRLEGRAPAEIFIRRDRQDAFGNFFKFGRPYPQRRAFSLRMRSKVGNRNVRIERFFAAQTARNGQPVPQLKGAAGNFALSYLMLGDRKSPKLSRGIFRAVFGDFAPGAADEAFDHILNDNRRAFLKLLSALELLSGEMIVALRQMARYQLEAMTACVGAREP